MKEVTDMIDERWDDPVVIDESKVAYVVNWMSDMYRKYNGLYRTFDISPDILDRGYRMIHVMSSCGFRMNGGGMIPLKANGWLGYESLRDDAYELLKAVSLEK